MLLICVVAFMEAGKVCFVSQHSVFVLFAVIIYLPSFYHTVPLS